MCYSKTITMKKTFSGFTIVEVLVVVTVIAILAGIGTFAYLSTQMRARDTKRLANVESITQAIELYARDKSSFPAKQGATTWEESSVQQANFLKPLYDASYLRGNPLVDPRNNTSFQYKYAVFDPTIPAQQNFCETNRGPYFVLGVTQLEALGMSGSTPVASPDSPGWKCGSGASSKDWQTEFSWVTGGYLDEFTTE